jgi:branched-chain amino acid transport system permease protein
MLLKTFFPAWADKPKYAYLATIALAIVLIVLPFASSAGGSYSWIRIIDLALLYVMLALGLNIVVGYAGLLDLGYVAFYAVGAYLYALLASPHLTDNFPWIAALFPNGLSTSVWIVVPLAGLVAAIFGLILGAPTLRLRGDYLAIVTLGFGEIIRIFMNNLNQPINLTNGPQGIIKIAPVSMFGTPFKGRWEFMGLTVDGLHLYYYLFLALTIGVVILTIRLQDSRIGRAWVAVREDEVAAKAMGINTTQVKLMAFAMGASFGGIAGAMFSAFQGFISPESFTLNESIIIVAMVVLGGMGHVPGVIIGAILLYAVPEALRFFDAAVQTRIFGRELIGPEILRMLIFGLSMVLVMLLKPGGLWPAPKHGEKAK